MSAWGELCSFSVDMLIIEVVNIHGHYQIALNYVLRALLNYIYIYKLYLSNISYYFLIIRNLYLISNLKLRSSKLYFNYFSYKEDIIYQEF